MNGYEYLLWKLDLNGKVLHKEFISKIPNGELPYVTIMPLPKPQDGAIIVGSFGDQYEWSLLHVDAAGMITKSINLINSPDAFVDAVLLADAKGVLMAGQYRLEGNVWKIDLDGKAIWKKIYEAKDGDTKDKGDKEKAKANDKPFVMCYSIALTDDQGGFMMVAKIDGTKNKFGMGKMSIWLVRCDEAGNILAEMTFPGRMPSICALGKDRFAILYDAGFAFKVESRVRVVDLELKQQWEKKAQFNTLWVDRPAICSIPSGRGFVLAGANRIQENENSRQECRFYQYDADGQIVSSATISLSQAAFLQTRVVCNAGSAYVAFQTKGTGSEHAKEAGIFEIPLRKQDK